MTLIKAWAAKTARRRTAIAWRRWTIARGLRHRTRLLRPAERIGCAGRRGGPAPPGRPWLEREKELLDACFARPSY